MSDDAIEMMRRKVNECVAEEQSRKELLGLLELIGKNQAYTDGPATILPRSWLDEFQKDLEVLTVKEADCIRTSDEYRVFLLIFKS